MFDFYARKRLREQLFERERGYCFYCDIPCVMPGSGDYRGCKRPGNEATIDHIILKRDGGEGTLGNSVLACNNCNHKRGEQEAWVFLAWRRKINQKILGKKF